MDERSRAQLQVIRAVAEVLGTAEVPAWLFGGWGLDARIGRITREHGDVEFWVECVHADRSKTALVRAGATALATQPPTEACEFTWDDVEFSTAYFDRQSDGGFSRPQGRWSDWLFPPDSFAKDAVTSLSCPHDRLLSRAPPRHWCGMSRPTPHYLLLTRRVATTV